MFLMSETFSERLVRLREAAGLKQADVSAETGIERTFLSKMEKGGNASSWTKMCALADLYNVGLDYLRLGKPMLSVQPPAQIVEDPDELALLNAWRAMDEDEKRAFSLMASRFSREAG